MRGDSRLLIGGQLIGQVALLAAIPLLTRIIPVHEMGLYQTAFSAATILQPLATLRREMLIPFGRSVDSRRHRFVGLGFAAGLSMLLLVASGLASYIGSRDMAVILASTALILGSFALTFIENAFLIRRGAQRRLALRNLLGGLASSGLQVGIAIFLPSAVAIGAALLLGRAIATVLTVARDAGETETVGAGERKNQRAVSAIVSAMVATASSQAIIIGTAATLGPAPSAQVAIGQRLAGAPASLVGQAFSQIALGAAAPLIREHRPGLTTQLRSQTVKTAIAAGLAAAALMVGAPILAVPLLGDGYQTAGLLTTILAIPLCLTLVALPATSLLIPLGRERQLALIQIGRLIAIVTAIGISSAMSENIYTVTLVTAAVWTVAYIPLLTAAFSATVRHDRDASGQS